jgi:phosphate transport system permease protein
VPSIVFGLFGYGLFVLGVSVVIRGVPLFTLGGFKFSLLSGALTLAVLVLPMVITAAEEALLTVPPIFREASLGLGSSKWQTIWYVVLPTALPGILTGVILAVGRAAGETAPILLTCVALNTGAGGMLNIQSNTLQGVGQGMWDFIMSPIMSLSYLLYAGATQISEPKNLPAGALTLGERNWGVALTLLIIVLGLNMIAMVLRGVLRGRRKW